MKKLIPLFILFPICFLLVAAALNRSIVTFSEAMPISDQSCVIIDPGHGGEDGGATSCTGILESKTNLEIALRLDDLLHLLGVHTKMIRRTDCSVSTGGTTIASRKMSDLKERVRMINETPRGLLVSIHQNTFPQNQYHGAQVFYASKGEGEALAKQLQTAFVSKINPGSNRKAKKATNIYLMDHIECTGVLIECGFISNPEEAVLLNSDAYQRKLCAVIAATVSSFLNS